MNIIEVSTRHGSEILLKVAPDIITPNLAYCAVIGELFTL
jgi:hypothetical protein